METCNMFFFFFGCPCLSPWKSRLGSVMSIRQQIQLRCVGACDCGWNSPAGSMWLFENAWNNGDYSHSNLLSLAECLKKMGESRGRERDRESAKSVTLTNFKCKSLQSISRGTNFDATLLWDNTQANLDAAQKENSVASCFAGANTFLTATLMHPSLLLVYYL